MKKNGYRAIYSEEHKVHIIYCDKIPLGYAKKVKSGFEFHPSPQGLFLGMTPRTAKGMEEMIPIVKADHQSAAKRQFERIRTVR